MKVAHSGSQAIVTGVKTTRNTKKREDRFSLEPHPLPGKCSLEGKESSPGCQDVWKRATQIAPHPHLSLHAWVLRSLLFVFLDCNVSALVCTLAAFPPIPCSTKPGQNHSTYTHSGSSSGAGAVQVGLSAGAGLDSAASRRNVAEAHRHSLDFRGELRIIIPPHSTLFAGSENPSMQTNDKIARECFRSSFYLQPSGQCPGDPP